MHGLIIIRAIIYEKAASFHASSSTPLASRNQDIRAEDHAGVLEHAAAEGGNAAQAAPPQREERQSVSVVRSAWNLTWPPVLPDHSVPAEDGFDLMPLLNIKVPRFWSPPVGVILFIKAVNYSFRSLELTCTRLGLK